VDLLEIDRVDPSRWMLSPASRRIESRFRLCTTRRSLPSSSEALVNTYGRSGDAFQRAADDALRTAEA